VLIHHFAYFLFLFLFESSVSFIFRIDLLLDSYIYLDCVAKLVLFGVGFSFARTADERCERVIH
jgi:hypothetical protein